MQLQDMERKLDDLVGDSPWSDGFSSSGGSSKGRSLLSTSERAAASPPTQTPSSRNVGSYKGRRGLQKKSGSHHKTHRSMHVDKLIEAQETFGTKNVFDDGMFAGTADPLKSLSKLNFESQTAELHSRFRNVAFGGEVGVLSGFMFPLVARSLHLYHPCTLSLATLTIVCLHIFTMRSGTRNMILRRGSCSQSA